MAEGMTCYERDEVLCKEPACLQAGKCQVVSANEEWARQLREGVVRREALTVAPAQRQADSTCYVERMKVRQIIMDCGDLDAEATSYLLHDIDQLPIATADDFAPPAESDSTGEADLLTLLGDYRVGNATIDEVMAAIRGRSPAANDMQYFEMLWQWFVERGAIDRDDWSDGKNADDFRQMLDEHERELVAQIPARSSQPECVGEEELTTKIYEHSSTLDDLQSRAAARCVLYSFDVRRK